jgi:hypothetical protein
VHQEISTLQARLAELGAEEQRLRAVSGSIPAYERNVRDLEHRLAGHQAPPSDDRSLEGLFAALHDLAMESSLRLMTYKPGTETRPGGSPVVEIGIEGRYHDVARFLAGAASLRQLLILSELEIRAKPGRDGGKTLAVACVFAVPPGQGAGLGTSRDELTYESDTRRDPFLVPAHLVRSSGYAQTAADRGSEGLSAVAVAEATVRGIARSGTRMLAIVEGPGGRAFVVRPADRLLDGTVAEIDAAGVVFLTDDPPTAVRVRKLLRPAGAAQR